MKIKFKNNSFKTNMILVFVIYTCIFFVTVSYFGFFNTKKTLEISRKNHVNKIENEISSFHTSIKSDLDLLSNSITAISMFYGKGKDYKSIINFIKESTFINNVQIIDKNGNGKKYTSEGIKYISHVPITIKENKSIQINTDTIQLISKLKKDEIIIIEKNNDLLDNEFLNKGMLLIKYKEDVLYANNNVDLISKGIFHYKKSIDTYDLTIILNYPKKYYDELDERLIRDYILMLVIYIAVLILLYVLFKKAIYIPVISIEKAINSLADGNFDVNLNINKSSEFYSLSNKINSVIKRLKDLINREYSAKILKKQAELNALQSQINPHFLYNTLESIRGLAVCEGSNNIAEMTKALSNLFKYNISQKNNLVTLKQELKNVDDYLTIQQYRFNNKFNVEIKIDSDTFIFRIPKLSIQPIIENAIHHGLEVKKGKGLLIIRAYRTEERLVINVEDNGIGIKKENLELLNQQLIKGIDELSDISDKPKNIGLMNVNERIRLYFGSEFGVRVYSTYGLGTNIEVVLPLVKYDM